MSGDTRNPFGDQHDKIPPRERREQLLSEKAEARVRSKIERENIVSGRLVNVLQKHSGADLKIIYDFFGGRSADGVGQLEFSMKVLAFQKKTTLQQIHGEDSPFDGLPGKTTLTFIKGSKAKTFEEYMAGFPQAGKPHVGEVNIIDRFLQRVLSRGPEEPIAPRRGTRPRRGGDEVIIPEGKLGIVSGIRAAEIQSGTIIGDFERKFKDYGKEIPFQGRILDNKSVTPKLRPFFEQAMRDPFIQKLRGKVPNGFELGFDRIVANITFRSGKPPDKNTFLAINRVDSKCAIAYLPTEGRFISTVVGGAYFGSKGFGNKGESNSAPLGTSQILSIKIMQDAEQVSAFSGDQRSPIRGLNGRKIGLDNNPRNKNSIERASTFNYGLDEVMDNTNNAKRLVQFHGGKASIGCTSYCDQEFMKRVGLEVAYAFKNNYPAFEENSIGT